MAYIVLAVYQHLQVPFSPTAFLQALRHDMKTHLLAPGSSFPKGADFLSSYAVEPAYEGKR